MATDKHGLAQIRNPETGVYLCSSVADSLLSVPLSLCGNSK
jgi:hypothetical protein